MKGRINPHAGAISRRSMLKTSTVAGLGMVGGLALTGLACDKKNLSGWVTAIVSAFTEMKPLLGDLGLSQVVINKISGWIGTAAKVAKDFDAAYVAGKFADAVTLFNNLGGLIAQIAGELGATDNRIIKLALVSISIARIAIATLLSNQAQASPEAMSAVASAPTSNTAEIKRLANVNIDGLLKDLYKH